MFTWKYFIITPLPYNYHILQLLIINEHYFDSKADFQYTSVLFLTIVAQSYRRIMCALINRAEF